jgi:hypothetical protein
VNAGGVELVVEDPTVGTPPVRLIVCPVAVLPAAVLNPAEASAVVGLGVGLGIELVVVYVSVQGQFVIVSVVG